MKRLITERCCELEKMNTVTQAQLNEFVEEIEKLIAEDVLASARKLLSVNHVPDETHWIDEALRNAIEERDDAFATFNASHDEVDWTAYSSKRRGARGLTANVNATYGKKRTRNWKPYL